jgi:hypothetical protein
MNSISFDKSSTAGNTAALARMLHQSAQMMVQKPSPRRANEYKQAFHFLSDLQASPFYSMIITGETNASAQSKPGSVSSSITPQLGRNRGGIPARHTIHGTDFSGAASSSPAL